ncbi:acetylglutamate kinase, chloroplastic-like [Macadamia integrifolia]|uniref:acetylglutamate kinase, chloroplastic-like n=1 Tax=Macadamia integrifolia TaxID=60698 RepID=UPI001C5287B2|nr:acetylglutamate kinase, chloroplastic-like [Macadamia integrifolia]XP_042475447.1 acetylglutamate kinase, chloroplastic-like [Macadamia integrifolia]XP_042475448.1 acetylglutamate kinase, chloroplastic-like [Macadamia integrifolia]XP_042475449.1 acetylglutamate kinase, chloroplastic-like [Macadamia integrifolia]
MFAVNQVTISSSSSISKVLKNPIPKTLPFQPNQRLLNPIRNQPNQRHHTTLPIKSSLSPPPPVQTPAHIRVDILSESLPFIQKFRGKTIVVKYGGAAMKSQALEASVINDLVLLSCVGLRPVFVHGGGPEINSWLGRVGLQPNFLNGLRVTDSPTMEIVEMVLVGKVNKNLVSLINKAGATAVGLSGKDGRLLTARPNAKSAELGFVGDIARVDPTILRPLIANDHIPVIASVAADGYGQAYNINADTVAGELAAALGAEKLILLTDVAGILEDRENPESLVKEIDIKGVKRMMEEGKIAGGMIPKVNCCVRSLAQGVRTASIIDGRKPHSLLLEILTDEGAGTMITG